MELKTIDGWGKSNCGSWDEYCKPGERVDEGVADYFLNIMPPRIMKMGYFQVGEPHSTAVNPKTKRHSETYATFLKVEKGVWEYRGHCFTGEITDVEQHKNMAVSH